MNREPAARSKIWSVYPQTVLNPPANATHPPLPLPMSGKAWKGKAVGNKARNEPNPFFSHGVTAETIYSTRFIQNGLILRLQRPHLVPSSDHTYFEVVLLNRFGRLGHIVQRKIIRCIRYGTILLILHAPPALRALPALSPLARPHTAKNTHHLTQPHPPYFQDHSTSTTPTSSANSRQLIMKSSMIVGLAFATVLAAAAAQKTAATVPNTDSIEYQQKIAAIGEYTSTLSTRYCQNNIDRRVPCCERCALSPRIHWRVVWADLRQQSIHSAVAVLRPALSRFCMLYQTKPTNMVRSICG